MSADRSLARRQAQLVAALVAGGPVPAGLDRDRVAATARALLRKRATAAAEAWPVLAATLGPVWPAAFAANRAGEPPVGGLRDGWHVARALRELGELPAPAAAELADQERAMHYDGINPPRPRRSARLLDWGRRLAAGR